LARVANLNPTNFDPNLDPVPKIYPEPDLNQAKGQS